MRIHSQRILPPFSFDSSSFLSTGFVLSHASTDRTMPAKRNDCVRQLISCCCCCPCPGSSFLATFAGSWGIFYPKHISSSRAHSNKIPTAIPMFSGSNFLMVPLPVSRDVDIHQKSKMAVAKMKCTYFTAVIAEEQFLIFSERI